MVDSALKNNVNQVIHRGIENTDRFLNLAKQVILDHVKYGKRLRSGGKPIRMVTGVAGSGMGSSVRSAVTMSSGGFRSLRAHCSRIAFSNMDHLI